MPLFRNQLRYLLPTMRQDMLWLPIGLWGLFVVVVLIVMDDQMSAYNVARSYLGGVLPLVAGVLSAYAVLDDPTLELQFSSPRRGYSMLLERLSSILVILTACALTYQVLAALAGVDLFNLDSNLLLRQLVWFAPSLAMIALGSAAGFAARHSTGGALVVAAVWIYQVILRDALALNPIGRYFYLFMGATSPDFPWLRANQISLLVLAGLLVWASTRLLKKQERYI